jgi:hypothetical protein
LQQYGSEVVVMSCGVVVGMMICVVVVVGDIVNM